MGAARWSRREEARAGGAELLGVRPPSLSPQLGDGLALCEPGRGDAGGGQPPVSPARPALGGGSHRPHAAPSPAARAALVKSRDMHWSLLAQRAQRDISLSSLRMLLVADGANPCE